MSADTYLTNILAREQVNTSPTSPVRAVQTTLAPLLQRWGGAALRSVTPSGSFAKGTANVSGTDIDLFVSLSETTNNTLSEIYESLFKALTAGGYTPRRQNVSLNIRVGGQDVDLVPAKRQAAHGSDHSLYRRKAGAWTKTNVDRHVALVAGSGRQSVIRVLKLWRNQKGLDFPSFYLELTAINALSGVNGTLSGNILTVFQYLQSRFANARVVDPANSNNIISDDLTATEKQAIIAAAGRALGARTWEQIVV